MLDFLGIGAQKSGTTYLYERLNQNENILFPGGKEIHFWNRLDSEDQNKYLKLFSKDHPGKKQGEITPAYALLPIDIINRIYQEYPRLKIIYIIRNPIDRAWSAALMALTRAEMNPSEASDQWFIDHFKSQGSLRRGDYETCIKNWLSVFPTEQFLILNFDQIKSDPKGLLTRCFNHIGIESHLLTDEINNPVFKGLGISIRPSLLPILYELYEKKIASLASLLASDLSDWMDSNRFSQK